MEKEKGNQNNVYAAICAVQDELAKIGIAKNNKNAQQGYRFRGIDDIYNTLAPLLAKHKICIVPQVVRREQVERQTARGGALFYTNVEVDYSIFSAVDGSSVKATIYGEAMDSADKSTNKAMSAAYKYLCLQLFCIPTEGDNDADATTYEVQGQGQGRVQGQVQVQVQYITPEQFAEFGRLEIDLARVALAYGVEDYKHLTKEQADEAIRRKKSNIKMAQEIGEARAEARAE